MKYGLHILLKFDFDLCEIVFVMILLRLRKPEQSEVCIESRT